MKVIDLLNKIANGEEVPKKIKVGSEVWNYDEIDYRAKDGRGYLFEVFIRINKEDLNEKVEIIEEDEKIEIVNTWVLCDSDFSSKGKYSFKATEIIDNAFEEYSHKINELIDEVNRLKDESR